jgi:hypothetical protein
MRFYSVNALRNRATGAAVLAGVWLRRSRHRTLGGIAARAWVSD